jgi:predicted small lipoprotein YifL
MRTAYLSILVVSMLSTACGAKASQLRAQAASDLHRNADQVVRESIAPYVERVHACGRHDIYAYAHGERRWVSPLERASFELSCPREQLTSQHLGALSVGVSGCGHKGVYVLTPAGWLMNSVDDGRGAPREPGAPEQAGPAREL